MPCRQLASSKAIYPRTQTAAQNPPTVACRLCASECAEWAAAARPPACPTAGGANVTQMSSSCVLDSPVSPENMLDVS